MKQGICYAAIDPSFVHRQDVYFMIMQYFMDVQNFIADAADINVSYDDIRRGTRR